MNRKDELLNQMIEDPLRFTKNNFMELVELVDDRGDKQVTFEDLRSNLLRIYDMNERSLQD